ncbi:MAG: SIS domain-containing protein [Firmicutes bacterium]|nr:SIS domain-containing protein [Bacillota bacterium]
MNTKEEGALLNLQLALDFIPLDEALSLCTRLEKHIDWIEAGTPLIKKEGIRAVERLKAAFPDKVIVADMKAVDAGAREAEMAFDAGADVISVLALAHDATIVGAVSAANSTGKRVVADLLGTHDHERVETVRRLEGLGVHMIGVHTGTDEQATGQDPLAALAQVSAVTNLPIMVAGGISPETIDEVLRYKPNVVVVGSWITGSADPAGAARALRSRFPGIDLGDIESTPSLGAMGSHTKDIKDILTEIARAFEMIDRDAVDALLSRILAAKKVFLAGAGRSGLMMKAFAMRLMHLGLTAYSVGEVVTPAIRGGDLLVAGTGSGETPSIVQMIRKALGTSGVQVAVITTSATSESGRLTRAAGGVVIEIPVNTPKAKVKAKVGDDGDDVPLVVSDLSNPESVPTSPAPLIKLQSIQPMGSLFEQCLLLLCDDLIMQIAERLGAKPEKMFDRHANLE